MNNKTKAPSIIAVTVIVITIRPYSQNYIKPRNFHVYTNKHLFTIKSPIIRTTFIRTAKYLDRYGNNKLYCKVN